MVPPSNPPSIDRWLDRRQQIPIATLLITAALSMAGGWWLTGGFQGAWVEIDRAPPRPYQPQIDINRADWPEISLLPGVSEMLARRIVETRERLGPYRSPEDLRRVSGIGPKTVERLRPWLDVGTQRRGTAARSHGTPLQPESAGDTAG